VTRPPNGSSENPTELRPILVLALDGATFDVIRPLAAQGRLPNLAAWMKDGVASGLASTTPPVTFPAWSSFMTGLSPADHGIFDFTQKKPGEYRLRFINWSVASMRPSRREPMNAVRVTPCSIAKWRRSRGHGCAPI